jgi:hypothetical protein
MIFKLSTSGKHWHDQIISLEERVGLDVEVVVQLAD